LCVAQFVYGQLYGHGVLSRRLTAVIPRSAVGDSARRAVEARQRARDTSCSPHQLPHLGHRSHDSLRSSALETRRGDMCYLMMSVSCRQATDQERCPRSRPRRTETSVKNLWTSVRTRFARIWSLACGDESGRCRSRRRGTHMAMRCRHPDRASCWMSFETFTRCITGVLVHITDGRFG
jgi:hypothetical protein